MSEADLEKKNVVFKISFSNPKGLSKDKDEPQMITEWNYTRIAVALIIVFIFIAVGIRIIQTEEILVVSEKKMQGKQIEEVETNIGYLSTKATDSIDSNAKKQAVTVSRSNKKQTSIKTPAHNLRSVVHAQLAKGVWKNEPFGKITGTIKVNSEEATGIFYFTELENMKDEAIFHIWKYNGDVIFKKKKEILKNHWKTYSSKLFTKRTIGSWSVETVDSNNRQLNLINFKVVAASD